MKNEKKLAEPAPSLNCRITSPQGENLEVITVGDLAILKCETTTESNLPDPLMISKGENDFYALKILNVESLNQPLTLTVTSYRVGEHLESDFYLVGSPRIKLEGIRFTVNSVIDPQKPVDKPFGPIGPLGLNLPGLYWILLVATLSLLVFGIISKIYLAKKRARLLLGLRQYEHAQTPFVQFHHRLRKMNRHSPLLNNQEAELDYALSQVNELDEILKLYLTRKLNVPAFDWGLRLILKELARHKIILRKEDINKLQVNFREIKKMKKFKSITSSEFTLLFQRTRKLVDELDAYLDREFSSQLKTAQRVGERK